MSSRPLWFLLGDWTRQRTPATAVGVPRNPFPGDSVWGALAENCVLGYQTSQWEDLYRSWVLSHRTRGKVGAGPMTPESLWPVSQQASPWAPLGSPWVCFGPRALMLHFTEELGWLREKICKGGSPLWTSCHLRWKMLCCLYTITIWDYKQWFN